MALRDSGQVKEAQAKVGEWRGRLAEVESLYYPKLSGMAYAAPMYRVRGGPFEKTESDWTQWGPYLHLEAVLAQPLYTFGRVEAGQQAALQRARVEEARARQTRNAVALETRKIYYLLLYARSLQPALDSARNLLDSALETARREHESGSGKVTMVDLQKLIYGSAELDRYRIQARIGAEIALAALKHTMALPQEATLTLADAALPPMPTDLPALPQLLHLAAAGRPEWAQLRLGRSAAVSLAQAERLANAPVVFAAGQLQADWTPMRPDVDNPYFQDRYNQIVGGLALGLQFNLDPARASARTQQAQALIEQIDALATFAATGIPIEVRKAREEWLQALEIADRATEGAAAAKKWMVFAGAGFSTGTAPAQDVLEGLVAWLSARRTQIESARDGHLARAQLLFVIGQDRDRLRAP
ncbi:MAG: TolC family protein [Deltaproteobacteria bacterium]|nr:TolC family protein [Deltaproteobacteria bacterium]